MSLRDKGRRDIRVPTNELVGYWRMPLRGGKPIHSRVLVFMLDCSLSEIAVSPSKLCSPVTGASIGIEHCRQISWMMLSNSTFNNMSFGFSLLSMKKAFQEYFVGGITCVKGVGVGVVKHDCPPRLKHVRQGRRSHSLLL